MIYNDRRLQKTGSAGTKISKQETFVLRSPVGRFDVSEDYTYRNGSEREETKFRFEPSHQKSAEIGYTYRCRDEYKRDGFTAKTESEINVKQSNQVYDFTSLKSKGSAEINNSGCVLYKDSYNEYAGIANSKIDAKTSLKVEENMNGTTAKIESGSSFELGIFEQKAEMHLKSSIQKDNLTCFQSEASIEGNKGKVNAKLNSTLFRVQEPDVDIKVLSGTAEVGIGIDEEMVKLNVSLVESNIGNFKSKVGFSLDTGYSIKKDSIEAKIDGFGIKLGKEMGISTPLGEISYRFFN